MKMPTRMFGHCKGFSRRHVGAGHARPAAFPQVGGGPYAAGRTCAAPTTLPVRIAISYKRSRPNLCKSPNIHVKLCEIDNTYFVDCCNPRIEIPHNIAYNKIIK